MRGLAATRPGGERSPLPPVSRTNREILAELEADPDLRRWHEKLDRQETTMNAQSRPACPICGAPMRRYGRGATLRKHGPEFVCPVAEAEEYEDERGHIKRRADARHDRVRFYSGDQLDGPSVAGPPTA